MPTRLFTVETNYLPCNDNSLCQDPYNHPGTVWMFGKVWVSEAQTWVSCCVTVKNIHRRIFLAKRDFFTNIKSGEVNEDKPVSGMDLYNEFNDKVGDRLILIENCYN